MADEKKPPAFQAVQKIATFKSPEELFGKLTGREPSHAYLRGPQQDVLREYEEYADAPNVSAELPTGTGKTTVGLLIAEWHRRSPTREYRPGPQQRSIRAGCHYLAIDAAARHTDPSRQSCFQTVSVPEGAVLIMRDAVV